MNCDPQTGYHQNILLVRYTIWVTLPLSFKTVVELFRSNEAGFGVDLIVWRLHIPFRTYQLSSTGRVVWEMFMLYEQIIKSNGFVMSWGSIQNQNSVSWGLIRIRNCFWICGRSYPIDKSSVSGKLYYAKLSNQLKIRLQCVSCVVLVTIFIKHCTFREHEINGQCLTTMMVISWGRPG